ncbi:trypsin-like peptidase domain-containing protein [Candidatus Uhrbacteria bacterium]|nr:trypsin-like peptidase domain-containing protein [Candidatus Uhrbacteria bacterium]
MEKYEEEDEGGAFEYDPLGKWKKMAVAAVGLIFLTATLAAATAVLSFSAEKTRQGANAAYRQTLARLQAEKARPTVSPKPELIVDLDLTDPKSIPKVIRQTANAITPIVVTWNDKSHMRGTAILIGNDIGLTCTHIFLGEGYNPKKLPEKILVACPTQLKAVEAELIRADTLSDVAFIRLKSHCPVPKTEFWEKPPEQGEEVWMVGITYEENNARLTAQKTTVTSENSIVSTQWCRNPKTARKNAVKLSSLLSNRGLSPSGAIEIPSVPGQSGSAIVSGNGKTMGMVNGTNCLNQAVVIPTKNILKVAEDFRINLSNQS